jgi:CheY-like chemotaxis protein
MTELKTITGEQDSVHSSIVLEDAPTVNILHVEDDEIVASVAREILEAQGWRVETCADGNAALEKNYGKNEYELMHVDKDIPGENRIKKKKQAHELDHL